MKARIDASSLQTVRVQNVRCASARREVPRLPRARERARDEREEGRLSGAVLTDETGPAVVEGELGVLEDGSGVRVRESYSSPPFE
jgi:hypothetical protein